MNIVFYKSESNHCPVLEVINKLNLKDRAKVLACLVNIEDLGFDCPRVQFRQIERQLWEIKIHLYSCGFRLFYVCVASNTMVLLHAYKKQTQKAPQNVLKVVNQRLKEVLENEKDYT